MATQQPTPSGSSSSSTPRRGVGADASARRTWDKEYYEQLAKEGNWKPTLVDPQVAKKEREREKKEQKIAAASQRSTVEQVRARLQQHSKRKATEEQTLDDRLKKVDVLADRLQQKKQKKEEQTDKQTEKRKETGKDERKGGGKEDEETKKIEVKKSQVEEEEDELQKMAAMMGLPIGFGSTKSN